MSHEFSHTSDLAGVFIVIFMILFFPLGILVAVLSAKKVRASLPVCVKDQNHWSKIGWYGGLGWMIIPIGVFTGLWLGNILPEAGRGQENPAILVACILSSIAMFVIPLVYMGTTRIKSTSITDKTIAIKGVSIPFARAVAQSNNSAER